MTEIGIKRKKHEIRVAGKLFEFYLIPVIVEELLIKHDEAYGEIGEKIKASEDFDSMGTFVNERNKICGGILFDALQALVEANGIEFDAGWWKSNIDYQGILEIISTMKVVEYADKMDKKSQSIKDINFDRLYLALKAKGLVKSKKEFYYDMSLADVSEAGAFVEREVWDSFIIKKDTSRVTFKPRDYTK